MLVLGIESSCDETSVAVVEDGRKVLSNVISSQVPIHERFVFPLMLQEIMLRLFLM